MEPDEDEPESGAEALLARGRRLMIGAGVERDAAEGARLIEQACAGGSAEAAAAMAAFAAMGAGRPQNWEQAFDYLLMAAERGSGAARRQLALLGRDPQLAAEAERPERHAGDLWKRLRAKVDVAALTAAPERRPISETPRVRVIERFATAAECDWAVAVAKDRLSRAAILDPGSGEKKSHPDRTNSAMGFEAVDMDVVIQVLRARIAAVSNLPVPVFEPAQIMHYSVGQEFRPHFDYMDPQTPGGRQELGRFGQRIATFLLYLNEDFEGGETEFPRAGIRYRGRKGDALLFGNVDGAGRPDPLTLHAGRPPTRGEKWILSQWIRDRSPGA
jgi:hypothetical protein